MLFLLRMIDQHAFVHGMDKMPIILTQAELSWMANEGLAVIFRQRFAVEKDRFPYLRPTSLRVRDEFVAVCINAFNDIRERMHAAVLNFRGVGFDKANDISIECIDALIEDLRVFFLKAEEVSNG